MTRARYRRDEYLVLWKFARMNPSDIGLDEHRVAMCCLPNVSETRLDLDTRDETKVGMCRNGGRKRAATGKDFQRPPGSRAAALLLNREGPHRRRDINHAGRYCEAGTVTRAIYELSGDTLRVCYSPEGTDRPTELVTREGSPWLLVTYKREKKAP